ncbi:MAG TPA: type ISP restriction/modification enzyme [Tepidisphaeraceae bacterium]
MEVTELAKAYHRAVHAAASGAVAAEEEAQLTTPVSNLFSGLAIAAGLGVLQLIRETRLGTTRPDFAALLKRDGKIMQKGYVELKAPSVPVDASLWTGRNAKQWAKMKDEADILIVCNGVEAQLYRQGHQLGAAVPLPYDQPDRWDAAPLTALLDRFFELKPAPVTNIDDLNKRLAVRTADLRDRILWLMERSGPAAEAAKGGYASWRLHVYPHATPRDFADGVSQVVAYGMVLAALTPGGADRDDDGHLSVQEARSTIRTASPVLAAAFAPLLDKPALYKAVRVEIGALETLVSAIDARRVATPDRRGDPWLRFYEDFLAVYDPDERRQAGVYYTPVDAVAAMTGMTEHLLVHRFRKRLGFGDASVVTLDPATGTGTFPLSAIDRATKRAEARGKAGPKQAARNLAANLFAFELLPGPYSVAHLRLSQRLTGLADDPTLAQVVLTDTLESPDAPSRTLESWGDAQVLAEEQDRANRIKLEQRVTVVIGNPPYRRVERDLKGRGSGGWVIDGTVPGRAGEKSLFDDILDVAKANTIFSHHASLYNLYVYFWRWAIWKAFEAHGDGPGVVAFITASSWLHGPGFVGLRKLARETADEIWVIDLGGDNKGANPEDNIFAIETPVAIVVLARNGASDRETPAPVHYRRVRGTAEDKLAVLKALGASDDPFEGEWQDAPLGWLHPMMPPSGDAEWGDMPLLTDLFPWQQPGCMFSRTWPVAPTLSLLARRWSSFVDAPAEERPGLFVTPNSGRNIKTKVAGLPTLAEAKAGDPPPLRARYGNRSFDRQWAFEDPRMAKTESPSLWGSVSTKQIFMTSLLTDRLGPGPALTVSAHVPDKHYFNGRGGKDVIPLWRDAAATAPNITTGLAAALGKQLGITPPSVEDLAAYAYALLSASAYQQRFAAALERPGLRVPITADGDLWTEAVKAGRELLWLHTFAERLVDPTAGRPGQVPEVDGIGWDQTVTCLPADLGEVSYDAETGTLTIGDGQLSGVRPEVWRYSVSGMQVLPKWLGYRTRKGAGRAVNSSSALDHIRPEEWADEWNDELLDLIRVLTLTMDREDTLTDLLDRISDGPLIPAGRLPLPTAAERQPPATAR